MGELAAAARADISADRRRNTNDLRYPAWPGRCEIGGVRRRSSAVTSRRRRARRPPVPGAADDQSRPYVRSPRSVVTVRVARSAVARNSEGSVIAEPAIPGVLPDELVAARRHVTS